MEIREGIKYKTSNEIDGCVFEIKDNKVYVHFNNNPRITGSSTINEMINQFEKGTLKLTYYPYKVGDWVIPIKSGLGLLYTDINTPYKLEKADTNRFNREFAVKVEGKLKDISVECLRPAFSNEIPISKETDIEDYSKYEVGCWYKNLGPEQSYIGKLTGFVTKNNFPSKEYINSKGILCKGVYFLDFKYATKISLEEIQQYLPDNHPDKIILKPKKKQFIKGEWYRNPGDFIDTHYIFAKFDKLIDNIFYFSEIIGPKGDLEDCWYYDGEAYDPTPIEEINKLQDYYNNNLKNKSTNMTDDFEEQLARQEQALALANLKKAPSIELKDDIGNKQYVSIHYDKVDKETTLKWYTDSLKQIDYKDYTDYIKNSYTTSSVSPERSSTLNQIKKRSRKVNYVSTTLIMK